MTSDYSALIQDIKNDIEKLLKNSISDYLDNANLALSSVSQKYSSIITPTDRSECLHQLVICRNDITTSYIESIKRLLRPFPVTETEKKQDKPGADDKDELSLSLVDHDEIEDMMQVKKIGEKVADSCREQISHLEARLEYLALTGDDIFHKRALSPTNLCQAFDDALANNFKIPCKKFLFSFYGDTVAGNFGALYDSINNKLIDAGILPTIKVKKLNKPKSKRRFYSGTDGQESTSSTQHGSAGQPPPGGTDSRDSGDEDAEQLDKIGNGYAMKAAPGQQRPASSDDIGMRAEQISRALDKFLGAALSGGAGAGGEQRREVFPKGTPQDFGHEEILSALSNLQSSPQFQQPPEMRFDAEAVKNAILGEIAKTSGGAVTKRINQLAEKTIDFIELVFDAIIEDDTISDTIKALLLRLQIPIIKASMTDPEFFIQDTHPARVLLDRIAEVGFGVTDHEDETYIELENVVSVIQNEYELQTSTFQKALDRLDKYVEEQRTLAQEKEEEAQRQVLREHARNTVLKALRSITAGKTLPENIHPLVLKRWPTLMYNHYLTHGKDNDKWVATIEALREIVTSVQPIHTVDELIHLKQSRDGIMERTRGFLTTTNRSKQDVDNVLEGLKTAHDTLLARARFNAEEIISGEQRLSDKETSAVANEAELEALSSLPDAESEKAASLSRLPTNIVPGAWFLIFIGDDKAPRRAKLSVIIYEDSKLVFVNHGGSIIVEKSFDEFTSELEEGKSRVIMGHSVFDHALSSVIGRLQDR